MLSFIDITPITVHSYGEETLKCNVDKITTIYQSDQGRLNCFLPSSWLPSIEPASYSIFWVDLPAYAILYFLLQDNIS